MPITVAVLYMHNCIQPTVLEVLDEHIFLQARCLLKSEVIVIHELEEDMGSEDDMMPLVFRARVYKLRFRSCSWFLNLSPT